MILNYAIIEIIFRLFEMNGKYCVYLNQQTNKDMKFQLNNWMTENREIVLNKFSELKEEQHYNGISLKQFGLQVYQAMANNNIKSSNRAYKMLPMLMSNVYLNNSNLDSVDYTSANDKKRINYFGAEKAAQLKNL